MNNEELTSYIRKCASNNIDSPIKLDEPTFFQLSLNLLVNKCSKEISVLIHFDPSGKKNPLFEILLSKISQKIFIEFLSISDVKLNIYTNEQRKVRDSNFFETIKFFKNSVNLRSIPKKVYDEKIINKFDIIIGDHKYLVIGSNENDESNYFVNFGDVKGVNRLNNYFLAMSNEINASGEKND